MNNKILKSLYPYVLYIAFAVVITSIIISLALSEIIKFEPCILCWYQRLAMYPLVLIIYIAVIKKDIDNIPAYVLPFSIIGGLIALYQSFIQWGLFSEKIIQCNGLTPCNTKYLNWFGFIDIPQLSFLAFLIITGCMLILRKGNKGD